MKAVHARRLLKLAEFLEELPPHRFEFGHWIGDDWEGAPDLSCGTTACALGWACSMPEFRRLGARINRTTSGYVVLSLEDGPAHSDEGDVSEHLFGLSSEDHMYLFCPGEKREGCSGLPENASAKRVAKHIRAFVAEECGD